MADRLDTPGTAYGNASRKDAFISGAKKFAWGFANLVGLGTPKLAKSIVEAAKNGEIRPFQGAQGKWHALVGHNNRAGKVPGNTLLGGNEFVEWAKQPYKFSEADLSKFDKMFGPIIDRKPKVDFNLTDGTALIREAQSYKGRLPAEGMREQALMQLKGVLESVLNQHPTLDNIIFQNNPLSTAVEAAKAEKDIHKSEAIFSGETLSAEATAALEKLDNLQLSAGHSSELERLQTSMMSVLNNLKENFFDYSENQFRDILQNARGKIHERINDLEQSQLDAIDNLFETDEAFKQHIRDSSEPTAEGADPDKPLKEIREKMQKQVKDRINQTRRDVEKNFTQRLEALNLAHTSLMILIRATLQQRNDSPAAQAYLEQYEKSRSDPGNADLGASLEHDQILARLQGGINVLESGSLQTFSGTIVNWNAQTNGFDVQFDPRKTMLEINNDISELIAINKAAQVVELMKHVDSGALDIKDLPSKLNFKYTVTMGDEKKAKKMALAAFDACIIQGFPPEKIQIEYGSKQGTKHLDIMSDPSLIKRRQKLMAERAKHMDKVRSTPVSEKSAGACVEGRKLVEREFAPAAEAGEESSLLMQ